MGKGFRTGQIVEVRSAAEIGATLDAHGELDRLPFMPEMLRHCGKRYRISAVAHKTCDTVCKTGGRTLEDAVHLEDLRCDGSGHGGCQAGCLLFWKTAWLRSIDTEETKPAQGAGSFACTESSLLQCAAHVEPRTGVLHYRCQATQLPQFTRLLHWWDVRQYIADITSGNASVGKVIRLLALSWLRALLRVGVGYRLVTRVHDAAHRALVGGASPLGDGTIPQGAQTPKGELGLTAGDRVQVRSHQQILETLNLSNMNRGMRFDPEMVSYCGKEYRVAKRVDTIINEVTGEMMQMKNPCIILDGVVCRGLYSQNRLMCPRAIYPFWREIWLQRAPPADAAPPSDAARSRSST